MKELDFYKYNKIFGLFAGLISFIVYSLTVEPTASYWDCAEYISTSAKLQIGHPPGAPFFQMMGAVFSMFASNNESIAIAVNFLSVVSSAFVILFLFWSTTLILKKISKKNNFTNDTNILLSSSIARHFRSGRVLILDMVSKEAEIKRSPKFMAVWSPNLFQIVGRPLLKRSLSWRSSCIRDALCINSQHIAISCETCLLRPKIFEARSASIALNLFPPELS